MQILYKYQSLANSGKLRLTAHNFLVNLLQQIQPTVLIVISISIIIIIGVLVMSITQLYPAGCECSYICIICVLVGWLILLFWNTADIAEVISLVVGVVQVYLFLFLLLCWLGFACCQQEVGFDILVRIGVSVWGVGWCIRYVGKCIRVCANVGIHACVVADWCCIIGSILYSSTC